MTFQRMSSSGVEKEKKMECILRPIVSSAYKRVSLKMFMHGPF